MAGARCVDLNCDLGESFGRWEMGMDEKVIPLVSSVNVACGMHAGDPLVMRDRVRLALASGVAVGAHPGYPDLQGFGRRDMGLSADEVYAFVLYQVGALAGFVRAQGGALHHVKPHGQLYNRAARDREAADAVARAVRDACPVAGADLVLVGLAGSELVRAGRDLGLATAGEFFLDRAYNADGTLVSRSLPGACLQDGRQAAERAAQALRTGMVPAAGGGVVAVDFQTVCVHGDGPHALEFTRLARQALLDAGVGVAPVSPVRA